LQGKATSGILTVVATARALAGGFGGAIALLYASRGWQGIFIGEGGRAAEVGHGNVPSLAEA
jgi:hypothetical protein